MNFPRKCPVAFQWPSGFGPSGLGPPCLLFRNDAAALPPRHFRRCTCNIFLIEKNYMKTSKKFIKIPLRSVAQTYLRPKLGHGFLFFDVLGSNFGLPDLSSWENIQLFMENSNPTSKILDFRTQGPKIDLANFSKIINVQLFSPMFGRWIVANPLLKSVSCVPPPPQGHLINGSRRSIRTSQDQRTCEMIHGKMGAHTWATSHPG